jgi:hypothetical protein
MLAVFVQVKGTGIDLLMVALVGLILLALERLIGAWLSDRVGPFATGMIFAALVPLLSWFFLSSPSGRVRTENFFAEAENRGYKTVFFKNPRAAQSDEDAKREEERRRLQASAPVPAPIVASVSNEPQAAEPAASSSGSESRVSKIFRSFFTRAKDSKTPTSLSVSPSPSVGNVMQRVVLRASVSGSGRTVTEGSVEFIVNGRGAGRILLDSNGVALATYLPALSGSYEVRARYTGSSEFDSSTSTAAFTVR